VACYTERVQITVPAELKYRLVAKARRRNMSLSALMREIVGDMMAMHELEVVCAEVEQRLSGATIQ
jgi:Ribbon-helix-helix protein, copG family